MPTKNTVNDFCLNKKEWKLNVDIDDIVIFKNGDSIEQVFNRF